MDWPWESVERSIGLDLLRHHLLPLRGVAGRQQLAFSFVRKNRTLEVVRTGRVTEYFLQAFRGAASKGTSSAQELHVYACLDCAEMAMAAQNWMSTVDCAIQRLILREARADRMHAASSEKNTPLGKPANFEMARKCR